MKLSAVKPCLRAERALPSSVRGPVDGRTGYVIDLGQVKAIVTREVIDKVDHRNLNLEVDFLRDSSAQPLHHSVLQYPQQFALQTMIQGRDLVQKEGP